ncbi:hypothetical protein GJ496_007983 [Pomphorhynchus laevis]|nr:hypothetical protein GJ496_007983 [Pomphorhynchus laevis]
MTEKWVVQIETPRELALIDSQVAFTMLTKGIQFRWAHLKRTCLLNPVWLFRLDTALFNNLVPAITGNINLNQQWESILQLPIGLGGLGIMKPSVNTITEYENSKRMCAPFLNIEAALWDDEQQHISCKIKQEKKKARYLQKMKNDDFHSRAQRHAPTVRRVKFFIGNRHVAKASRMLKNDSGGGVIPLEEILNNKTVLQH